MQNLKIFIVEDDSWYSEILAYNLLLNPDYVVEVYDSGKSFLKNLYKNPDIVSLDYTLPDIDCEILMERIWDYNPDIPIIIVSGQQDINTAIHLLKKGAYDYIVKDDDVKERVWNAVKNLRVNLELRQQLSELKQEISNKYTFSKLIKGRSPEMQSLFGLMEKAVASNINVSVSGETGTGKEMVAKSIHYNSRRKDKPFVPINVSAVPAELIESELFGHEKGSFTGAETRRIGKLELAHQGTLFLDEIAEMELSVQAKLLRVLQEREFTRVGGNELIKTDIRLITATNKDLRKEVAAGNFREDLFYRIIGLPLHLPPLRQRPQDIALLAQHFCVEFSRENNQPTKVLTQEAMDKLLKYPFPGNIRELKSVIELAVVMSDSKIIGAEHIIFNSFDTMSELMLEECSLKEYEVRIISHFLKKYEGNVNIVAQKLNIGKSTLYRMLKNNELES